MVTFSRSTRTQMTKEQGQLSSLDRCSGCLVRGPGRSHFGSRNEGNRRAALPPRSCHTGQGDRREGKHILYMSDGAGGGRCHHNKGERRPPPMGNENRDNVLPAYKRGQGARKSHGPPPLLSSTATSPLAQREGRFCQALHSCAVPYTSLLQHLTAWARLGSPACLRRLITGYNFDP